MTDFVAYDADPLSDTVGVYHWSDLREGWHRVKTIH